MPPVTRQGDIGSGHGCFPSSASNVGSPTTSVDGKPVVRVGDAYAAHGCSVCPPHERALAAGSPTVFIDGLPAGRIGDAIDCGGNVAAGSGTVTIDDG